MKRFARRRDVTGMVMQTQTAATQDMSRWWPSKYGVEDQAGALNEITPGKVLDAVRLVRAGRVYDLAHVLHQDIPAFPGRTFRQYLTTNYHQINRRRRDAGPAGLGRNSVNWIVEQITATQQMGTHMDGLNHLQAGDRTYNGFALCDIVEDHGTNRLGIDTLPQVVTRGGPYPPEDPDEPFVVPQTLNVRHGAVVVENLRLDEVARDRVHEFLLVISHAKLRGATGAWVAPLAIL